MSVQSDQELLREFVQQQSQQAFAELVRRHVDWVNSMARRLVHGDRALADDVTQAVFVLLAQKAHTLHRHSLLSGWLFTVTRFCVKNALRNEINRRKREREAAAMRQEAISAEESPAWEELAPMLDEFVGKLRALDREAVLLRFYQGKSFQEIGAALEMSEEAARKRVSRAIDQMRGRFSSRGLTVGAAALAGAMSSNLTQPASAALVATAQTGSTAGAGMATPILKGASAMLAWISLKPIAAVVLTSLIAISAATVVLQTPAIEEKAAATPTTAPAAPLATTHYGRVVTEEDTPVAGARVWRVDPMNGFGDPKLIGSTHTDADGRFQFAERENALVIVQAPGYAFGGGNVRSNWPDDPFEIRLQPVSKLAVRFVDPDDKPVAGMRVTLTGVTLSRRNWVPEFPAELKQSLQQTTNAQGGAVFENVPPGGGAWLDVSSGRFAQLGYARKMELSDSEVTDGGVIHLQFGGSISGRVVFADGKPAAKIQVVATGDPGGGQNAALTDEQGRYEIKQMHAGTYCVVLFLTDEISRQFAAAAIENVRVLPGVHLDDQDFRLITGGTIRGKIAERQSGKPLSGIRVFVQGPSRPGQSHLLQAATSDADGIYQIHVPPGAQTVQFGLPVPPELIEPNPLQHEINVAENQIVDVNYEVDRNPSSPAKGRAVDPEGHPLAGADIYLQVKNDLHGPDGSLIATTDADGNFTLPFADSSAVLRARQGRWTTLQPMAVKNAEPNLLILHKDMQASVRIIVQQPDGKPLAGAKASITAGARNDLILDTRTTGPDGSCIFKSLEPDMSYGVAAQAKGFGRTQIRSIQIAAGKQTEVAPIILQRADSFVEGLVIDEEGNPVADVKVLLNADLSSVQSVRTDVTGHFRIVNVVPSDVLRLFASTDTRSGSLEKVPAGASNIVINISPRPSR